MPRIKGQVSSATSLPATETDKGSIGQITVSKLLSNISAVWIYVNGGAGITTLENRSGIFTVESDDYDLKPFTLPLEVIVALTSGVIVYQPRLWPVNWDKVGGAVLEGFVTLDLAQTVNPTARWGFLGS